MLSPQIPHSDFTEQRSYRLLDNSFHLTSRSQWRGPNSLDRSGQHILPSTEPTRKTNTAQITYDKMKPGSGGMFWKRKGTNLDKANSGRRRMARDGFMQNVIAPAQFVVSADCTTTNRITSISATAIHPPRTQPGILFQSIDELYHTLPRLQRVGQGFPHNAEIVSRPFAQPRRQRLPDTATSHGALSMAFIQEQPKYQRRSHSDIPRQIPHSRTPSELEHHGRGQIVAPLAARHQPASWL
jgi:hypothetical protein